MTKYTIAACLLITGFIGIGASYGKTETKVDNKLASATVMITDMSGRSGGTGVVIATNSEETKILTNAHVCGLLPEGGKVVSDSGKSALATAYKVDENHDLCLVKVNTSLGLAATIANQEPKEFENCSISGHPNLLPTTITKGHIGANMVVQVLTKIKPCTEEEENSDLGVMCIFFGGIPVVKTYESTYATATIMAGSSGSGVYNDNNELVGLAFAGSGDISYAHTVPFNYLKRFVNKTVTEWSKPDYTLNWEKELSKKNRINNRELVKKCENTEDSDEQIKKLCKVIVDTIKWQNP